jgi:hypothetical protein
MKEISLKSVRGLLSGSFPFLIYPQTQASRFAPSLACASGAEAGHLSATLFCSPERKLPLPIENCLAYEAPPPAIRWLPMIPQLLA